LPSSGFRSQRPAPYAACSENLLGLTYNFIN
jgi:hypothetical protein